MRPISYSPFSPPAGAPIPSPWPHILKRARPSVLPVSIYLAACTLLACNPVDDAAEKLSKAAAPVQAPPPPPPAPSGKVANAPGPDNTIKALPEKLDPSTPAKPAKKDPE